MPDIDPYGAEGTGRIAIYTPYGRFPFLSNVGVAIRAAGVEPTSLVSAARTILRSIDPGIALHNIATLNQRLSQRIAMRVLTTWIILGFAAFATLLSGVGIHSVMSYVVGERTRELGLIIALGARDRDIAKFVMRKGILFSLLGILLGLSVAASASVVLSRFLFGIDALSPAIYTSVAGIALIVTAVACFFPAQRATRVDPLVALKAD